MSEPAVTCPLAHLSLPTYSADPDRLQLVDCGYIGVFQLLGSPLNPTQIPPILGTQLQPGEAAESKLGLLFAVAPSQWMLFSKQNVLSEITLEVGDAINVVDLSFARNAFRLTGPNARTVLAKGCALDTHSGVIKKEWCAQTAYHDIAMTVYRSGDDPDTFEILCFSGFAESLWTSLMHAGEEYSIFPSQLHHPTNKLKGSTP